jgi:putative acetyltransferase
VDALISISRVEGEDPAVDEVLARHHALMRTLSPEESCHVMTSAELRASGAQVHAVREGDRVLGVAALKPFGSAVELKSMHTVSEARGRGVGARLLGHLVGIARADGASTVFLETGSGEGHAAARALYMRAGFVETGPFGTYREDPESVFMRLDLR